jgi:hypothetical protein
MRHYIGFWLARGLTVISEHKNVIKTHSNLKNGYNAASSENSC